MHFFNQLRSSWFVLESGRILPPRVSQVFLSFSTVTLFSWSVLMAVSSWVVTVSSRRSCSLSFKIQSEEEDVAGSRTSKMLGELTSDSKSIKWKLGDDEKKKRFPSLCEANRKLCQSTVFHPPHTLLVHREVKDMACTAEHDVTNHDLFLTWVDP